MNEETPERDPRQLSIFGWRGFMRESTRLDDLAIIFVASGGIVLLLGLAGFTSGGLIDPLVSALRRWLGLGAFSLPLILFALVPFVFRHRKGLPVEIPWMRLIALEVVFFDVLALLALVDGMELPRAEQGYAGGIVGWGISSLLRSILGTWGGAIALFLLVVPFTGLALGGLAARLRPLWQKQTQEGSAAARMPAAPPPGSPAVASRDAQATKRRQPSMRNLPRAYRKNFQVEHAVDDAPAGPLERDAGLPPLDLLDGGQSARVTSREINLAAGLIEKTLADFGLPARVVDFRTGPAVTQYAVEPGFVEHVGVDGEIRRQKVRVSQISALASDLALALSAPRLRIEAPVPGQAYVGIEVPNRRAALVHLKPLLESSAFQRLRSPLTITLGRDVSGAPVAADLISMPHLLIAGTTGSGKSVCITAIATCLAFNNTPQDLRLVMIDPKMVELIRFNGLPHLFGKVETNLERITGVLRWCTAEMDRRYRALEEARARDLEAYNRRARRSKALEVLPRIVILIDELADLMMMAPDQTEQTLVRLAQMARAVGIHLVVATQRPSTDILTGLIKANFPARISFAVASSVDSRVILDGPGAETLLGRGDMLFLPPEAGAPIRLQGTWVSDREVEALLEFWEGAAEPSEDAQEAAPPWEPLLAREAAIGDRDEFIERAIEVVRTRGEASASLLQRALRIGYPRAARLMDELEELGIIGRAQSGGRTREVLIGKGEDPLNAADEDASEPDQA